MVKRRRVRIEIGTAVKDFESEVENVERLNTDKSIPDRNVMDQNKDSSDDILEGLDLEGVSEQEKEEIKRALIASRQDHLPGSVVSKEAGFRDGRPRQNTQEEEGQNGPENIKIDALNSYEELIEGKMISKDNKVQDVNPDDPIDDDDETQPPSDQENHLDLSRNTLQMEDDTAYICNTDDDDTSVHRRHRSPYPVPQQRNMEMDFDVSAEQPSVDESVSILVDDTEAQELENMEQGSPESGGLSPKAEVPRSAESQSSQGSQRSNYEGEGSGKMGDEGQKCEEIQDYRVESDHQEAYQENPADSLYRHYRAVTFQEEVGVECPLCSISFPKSVIEEHASNCDGTVPDLGHQSPEVHYGGDQDGAVGGAHVPMPGACNFPVELQDESDEDPLAEEEHTSGGEVEDTDVQDVIKDIKNSPGEEGQCEQCYICDEYCLKGQPFDQHLAQCMLKAKQQQAKVDSKGYEQAFTPQRHEQPADVRQTRRQVRHKQQDEEEEPVSVEKPMLNRRRQLYKRPSSATSTADRNTAKGGSSQ